MRLINADKTKENYKILKDFIYAKADQVDKVWKDNDSEFGKGMKEAFRRIKQEIEEVIEND